MEALPEATSEMRGHRGRLINGDEWDAFTGWRRVLFWHQGELRKIKRRYSKRMRKQERVKVREEVLDGLISL